MQYQLLPDLTQEEYAALKADIAERGVMVPVELDESGNVLDGHHRLRAVAELGITDYPTIIRPGLSDDEKREHVLALNLDRRHLTREQRQELVVTLRGQGWSLRRIGEKLSVDPVTVRNDLIGVENSTPDEVTGKDGKTYPAHRPAPVMAPTRAAAEQELQRQIEPEPEPEPEPPKPHVTNNSGENEWYTPAEYVDAARALMGGIDLDPASSEAANEVVGATEYYSLADDGLQHEWRGRVWMNPPYGQDIIGKFVDKLLSQLGNIEQAVVLVNNATETQWFQALGQQAAAVCLLKGRIRFWAPGRSSLAPLQGQAVLYFGDNVDGFAVMFEPLGLVLREFC